MKPVTVYEANDGTQFSNPVEASRRDNLLDEIKSVMLPLGEAKPLQTCEYRQHSLGTVETVTTDILRLCSREFGQCFTNIRGIVGRYADDNNSPLAKATWRLHCIDSRGREWDQPYRVQHQPSNPIQV